MRRERWRDSPRGIVHEESFQFSHYGCDNSATPSYLQCGTVPKVIAREMEEEDVLKEETLGDYLQEYESQTQIFRDHLNFQGFFKIKEYRIPSNHDRSTRCKQQDVGRFFLSTFDGSPKCSVRAWVEELVTYLHQHQVSQEEAIRVASLHLEVRAYAWWFYESSSLYDGNISTYERFTRKLVKRFDEKHSETSLVKLAKHTQTKPFHELEGSIHPTPIQKKFEGIKNLHNILLKARSPF